MPPPQQTGDPILQPTEFTELARVVIRSRCAQVLFLGRDIIVSFKADDLANVASRGTS
jgi:hypothetical protein